MRKPFLGLVQRREGWRLTWRGRFLSCAVFLGLVVFLGRGLSSFLALNAPITADVLVVEGWAQDYALTAAIAEFKQHTYTRLYVTGGPLQTGAPLSEYKTYAELGAATIGRLGIGGESVQAVPASGIRRDRTYTSALALKDWLREHGVVARRMNVISVGPHARRTRLLFEKAFSGDMKVGMIAIEDQDYDPKHWWRSSAGVRSVVDELIAYGYVRLFFHPSSEKPLP